MKKKRKVEKFSVHISSMNFCTPGTMIEIDTEELYRKHVLRKVQNLRDNNRINKGV